MRRGIELTMAYLAGIERLERLGGCGERGAELGHPVVERLDPGARVGLWPPSGRRGERVCIGYVISLITFAPGLEPDLGPAAAQRCDQVEQLEQAERAAWAAADVERAAADRIDPGPGAEQRVDEVIDEQHVADLVAVAVDRDRGAGDCADQE